MTTRTKYQGITLLQTKRKNHINHAIYNIYNIILTEIDSDFINRKEIMNYIFPFYFIPELLI